MEILIILLIVILLIWIPIEFRIRNIMVHDFIFILIKMAADYELRRLYDERSKGNAFEWFVSKHSYERYLFSFKPLKLESWFTEEELEEIRK